MKKNQENQVIVLPQAKVENYEVDVFIMSLFQYNGMKKPSRETPHDPYYINVRAIPKELAEVLERTIKKAMSSQFEYDKLIVNLG